jgi:hypothetical protein
VLLLNECLLLLLLISLSTESGNFWIYPRTLPSANDDEHILKVTVTAIRINSLKNNIMDIQKKQKDQGTGSLLFQFTKLQYVCQMNVAV